MIWFFYYLFIYLMVAGIRISSLWNQKSKLWLQGRKDWYKNLDSVPEKKSNRIWFHVSSLGEFEQARPVIEKLKEKQSSIEIILSFFLPVAIPFDTIIRWQQFYTFLLIYPAMLINGLQRFNLILQFSLNMICGPVI